MKQFESGRIFNMVSFNTFHGQNEVREITVVESNINSMGIEVVKFTNDLTSKVHTKPASFFQNKLV